ncbi:MAG: hypothetical protein Q9183_004129 [Haloplaca sp. 2 TL-2023]
MTLVVGKRENDTSASKDKDQEAKGVTNQDLELAVVEAAFYGKIRKYNDDVEKISDEAWKTARGAVRGDALENCKRMVEEMTVVDNLLGIAERIK